MAPVASNDPGIVKILIVMNDGSKQSFEVAYLGAVKELSRKLEQEMAQRGLDPTQFQFIKPAFELPDGSEFRQVIQNGQEPTAVPTGDSRPNWLPSWDDIFRTHIPWCLVLAGAVYNVGLLERRWQPEQ